MYKDAPNSKASLNSKPLKKKTLTGIDAIMQQYETIAAKDTALFRENLKSKELYKNLPMDPHLIELGADEFHQKHINDLKIRQAFIAKESVQHIKDGKSFFGPMFNEDNLTKNEEFVK